MIKTEYPRIGETVLSETLDNGLRVAVVPKPGYRRRYAFFTTRYGGMDMRFRLDGVWHDTPAGIAHYLEHKMFDTAEGNALQTLSLNGAEPNAFTANAMTAYYFDCTERFAENLRILLSFVSVPYFTQESVDKERGIIAQEIRMTEDTPDWRVYKNLLGCLYRNNPARVPIAGTVESIQDITPETLYACHKAFYAPSNMLLCVVGDVDPEEVLALAREVLPAGRGAAIERDYGAAEPPEVYAPSVIYPMEIAQQQYLVGFKCPAEADGEALFRQSLIGELACDLLFGESSPLYMRLYDEGLINSSFGGDFDQLPGAAYVFAGGEGKDPEAVARAIMDEAARLAREGVDADWYEQIRRANFGATLRSLNSFENIAVGMADACFRGYDAFRFPEVYDSITKADIEDFLRENIVEERRAMSVLVPRGEVEA
ncbi:MAG: insulinase family protein [Oscillospiraceae bacterium]|nr:insulinase family protein [Oscillospiraceae bacterium]